MLLVGPPGGGTVDRYTPNSLTGFLNHQFDDVLPYLYCCKLFSLIGEPSLCDNYYQKRPSSDGAGYQLPVPGNNYVIWKSFFTLSYSP